ncbi:MAG: hypothetical protein A3I63_00615 [Betaproteobacteria bacterium RIFCSPLOWO2_02_FULL_66_14]|nr:MAG: hypothetical protein A3I63_00615 [Betaproteobacteria bacterium RIFCSPLOWO2_02_FULL_66_14]
MATCSTGRASAGTTFCADLIAIGRLALLAMVMLAATSPAAGAADNTLSALDEQCLGCHSVEGMKMKLANGETLSLHVDGAAFAKSVHNLIGCAVCHRDVTLENHPPLKKKIASLRENSLALAKICSTCHAAIFKQYEGSIHAVLQRAGSPGAPICTDCHAPHAVMSKSAYDAASGAPCSGCHDPVFKAYAGSVHGEAALGCANCHRAHDVNPATTGEQLKNACLGCHEGTLSSHKAWLPNAERHFDAVSCPACHSPTAKRKVDLRLYDAVAKERVVEKAGVPQFESRARSADAKGLGLDALALQSLLLEFNREGAPKQTTLRGRLEVTTGAEAHQLAPKAKAIQDCATCHRRGADPFQSVTVSIVGADGRPVRYDAQQGVLNSMISVDSVGGFYAIGGTRIEVLDMLFVLALLIGIAVPVGHLTLTWLFRRTAKRIGGREDS